MCRIGVFFVFGSWLLAFTACTYDIVEDYDDIFDKEEAFHYWVAKQTEEGKKWLEDLPDCPCSISVSYLDAFDSKNDLLNYYDLIDDYCANELWVLDNAMRYNFLLRMLLGHWTFHPGSFACIRSTEKAAGYPHGQQCCYDSNGRLITHGTGAGSPDIATSLLSHHVEDVMPWLLAVELDKKHDTRQNMMKYLELRPPNNGLNCTENIVN